MSYQPAAALGATSVTDSEDAPPVTVQFLRWHPHGSTAYQKNQFAGFTEEIAQRLVRAGAARIVERK